MTRSQATVPVAPADPVIGGAAAVSAETHHADVLMDIVRLSADMLPKLGGLFSGYYVTKALSTAHNDDVEIASKHQPTFLSLEYATNPENMGFQTQISHFQRSKTGMSILRKQLQSFSSL